MTLMFLVYLVQMIGPLGWVLMVAGLLYCVFQFIYWLCGTQEFHLEDGIYTLQKPFKDLEVGKQYKLSMYIGYGYILASENIKLSRPDLNNLFRPDTPSLSFSKLAMCAFVIGFLLPNKETTIYMAGAYMVQQVVTSDTVQEIGNLAADATKAQLKAWAKESPELATLLVQSGIDEAKAVIKEEIAN